MGKPILAGMMAKQGLKPEKGTSVDRFLRGMNWRMGRHSLVHCGMVVYMVVETLVLRYRIASK